MACDSPVCVDPCPKAAPPRYCPANMTSCASGCVCMLECRSPTYVCFQTKFCMAPRRYLTRNTKHPYYHATIAEVMEP
ncbi:jg6993 [Pararge aegeria aegeria]|uniref:Jg6993 protein n=2 Tax=Pararge aegeria TaxID=116150 RepID=A0A8S4SE72_9NEOP|nr:jg6993 [Pararge aegeria aegeria]